MLRTMITATNTMSQLQLKLDTIGNNLSNVGTFGYKARDAKFQELLYQQFNNDKKDTARRESPLGIRYGAGAFISQTQMNWKQGAIQETGRQLDFAFNSPKQYFQILKPTENGELETVYSRQGNFYANPVADGRLALVNGDGYFIPDANGNPILLKEQPQSISMADGGLLTVTYADGSIETNEIAVTKLEKPQLMLRISDKYIGLPNNLDELGLTTQDIITDLQGADRTQIKLSSGQLEMSNVNMAKELTEMINTQRAYSFNARAVTMGDQMLGLINGIR